MAISWSTCPCVGHWQSSVATTCGCLTTRSQVLDDFLSCFWNLLRRSPMRCSRWGHSGWRRPISCIAASAVDHLSCAERRLSTEHCSSQSRSRFKDTLVQLRRWMVVGCAGVHDSFDILHGPGAAFVVGPCQQLRAPGRAPPLRYAAGPPLLISCPSLAHGSA